MMAPAKLADLELVLRNLDHAIAAAYHLIPGVWTHDLGEAARVRDARRTIALLRAERDALEDELAPIRALMGAA